uniref:Uncharacterized protein n=1 Tax=Lepeophtheirus salmonis TaxID=72036 RepID=A0A0K2VC21_LEPSM
MKMNTYLYVIFRGDELSILVPVDVRASITVHCAFNLDILPNLVLRGNGFYSYIYAGCLS